jgi:hypothetical protein
MGTVLVSYFDKAKQKGGLSSLVKLAMLVKMSRQDADKLPDSQENIDIFENAMKQL